MIVTVVILTVHMSFLEIMSFLSDCFLLSQYHGVFDEPFSLSLPANTFIQL